MYRWYAVLALLLFVGLAAPARAEQPRCPLPLGECMAQFGHMRERPWLGVEIVRDSLTGERRVQSVVPGGPAAKAGVKPGDILQKLGGVDPQLWFAGKAGWKAGWRDGEPVAITVGRAGREQSLTMPLGHVPEETLAAMIGVHVLEGHLAYSEEGQAHEEH
jgi:predicted metalloprotease with PDZ domain